MDSKTLLTGIGVLIFVGGGGWYYTNRVQPAPAPAAKVQPTDTNQPQSVTHTLSLAERKLTPDTVSVTEGETATIKATSDEKGEFHVSGYEIETFMPTPGSAIEFTFTADKPGRFNLEFHPGSTAEAAAAAEDIVIGALVVNPR